MSREENTSNCKVLNYPFWYWFSVLSNGITGLFGGTNLEPASSVQPCINQKGPYTGDVWNGARTFIMRLDLETSKNSVCRFVQDVSKLFSFKQDSFTISECSRLIMKLIHFQLVCVNCILSRNKFAKNMFLSSTLIRGKVCRKYLLLSVSFLHCFS